MTATSKKYFNEINIMRGMAVLCVVIGHSFDATDTPSVLGFLKSFVYCFHMPAFFFISGFLVKEQKLTWQDKAEKIKKKAVRLMVPYFFLTLVTVGLKVVFGAFARNPMNYNTLLIDVLIGRNNPNGGLWFLYGLFVVSAVGIILNEIDVRIMFAASLILNILNVLVFKQEGYVLAFFISYAWFYFGGTLVRRYCYTSLRRSINLKSTGVKIITAAAVIVFLNLAYVKIYVCQNELLSLLVAVCGVLLLLTLACMAEQAKGDNKFWMTLGTYGMDIYMIGYYVQQSIYVVLGKILNMDYLIYSWCMCIFGLILPILISKYIVRKNKVLSLLILGQ